MAAVTGVIVYLLWQLDQWWWRTLAGVIAAFGFLLIAAGGIPQLFTHEPSAMPEEAKPEDGPIRGEATR